MMARSYTPNKPGFIERHPWRCLLLTWLAGVPLRMGHTLELVLLPDVMFVAGVVLLIVGYARREKRTARQAEAALAQKRREANE